MPASVLQGAGPSRTGARPESNGDDLNHGDDMWGKEFGLCTKGDILVSQLQGYEVNQHDASQRMKSGLRNVMDVWKRPRF